MSIGTSLKTYTRARSLASADDAPVVRLSLVTTSASDARGPHCAVLSHGRARRAPPLEEQLGAHAAKAAVDERARPAAGELSRLVKEARRVGGGEQRQEERQRDGEQQPPPRLGRRRTQQLRRPWRLARLEARVGARAGGGTLWPRLRRQRLRQSGLLRAHRRGGQERPISSEGSELLELGCSLDRERTLPTL